MLTIIKGCAKIDPINSVKEFHDKVQTVSFKNSMFEAFMPSKIKSNCSGYESLSREMDIFNDGADKVLQYSSDIIDFLQCERVHHLYVQLSHETTCRDVPIYVTSAIYTLSILAFFSMVMVMLKLAWKSDIDIFLEDSNCKRGEDSSSISEEKKAPVGISNSIADEISQEEDTQKRPNLQISTPSRKIFTPGNEFWKNKELEDYTNSLVASNDSTLLILPSTFPPKNMRAEGFQTHIPGNTKIFPFKGGSDQPLDKRDRIKGTGGSDETWYSKYFRGPPMEQQNDKNREKKKIKRKIEDLKLENFVPNQVKEKPQARIKEKERIKQEVEQFKLGNNFKSGERSNTRLKSEMYRNHSFPPSQTNVMIRHDNFPSSATTENDSFPHSISSYTPFSRRMRPMQEQINQEMEQFKLENDFKSQERSNTPLTPEMYRNHSFPPPVTASTSRHGSYRNDSFPPSIRSSTLFSRRMRPMQEQIQQEVEQFKLENDFKSQERSNTPLTPEMYRNHSFPPPVTASTSRHGSYRNDSFPPSIRSSTLFSRRMRPMQEQIQQEVEQFKLENDFKSEERADTRFKSEMYRNDRFPLSAATEVYRNDSFPPRPTASMSRNDRLPPSAATEMYRNDSFPPPPPASMSRNDSFTPSAATEVYRNDSYPPSPTTSTSRNDGFTPSAATEVYRNNSFPPPLTASTGRNDSFTPSATTNVYRHESFPPSPAASTWRHNSFPPPATTEVYRNDSPPPLKKKPHPISTKGETYARANKTRGGTI